MKGELFRYGQNSAQVAFQSGNHRRHLVLIPGLTNGLLSLPYAPGLAATLDSQSWSLVQPLMSSSYQGFGTVNLDTDAAELRELLVYLKNERSCSDSVLMGHSTGCQDVVRFMKLYKEGQDIPNIQGVILQAPVSDQDFWETLPETESRIQKAKEMVAKGCGDDIFARLEILDNAPVTAKRFLALNQRYGDDDMFSSYFSDEDLKSVLGHMKDLRSLVLCSENDEYIPSHVDRKKLWERIGVAMGPLTEVHIIDGANHAIDGKEESLRMLITQFLDKLEKANQS
eukprot:g691.t1